MLKDEVMAVIDSRELAAAKASYFAAIETVSLAEATYNREKSYEIRIFPQSVNI